MANSIETRPIFHPSTDDPDAVDRRSGPDYYWMERHIHPEVIKDAIESTPLNAGGGLEARREKVQEVLYSAYEELWKQKRSARHRFEAIFYIYFFTLNSNFLADSEIEGIRVTQDEARDLRWIDKTFEVGLPEYPELI